MPSRPFARWPPVRPEAVSFGRPSRPDWGPRDAVPPDAVDGSLSEANPDGMRQVPNSKRSRGRNGRKPHNPHGGGGSKNQTFDSSGPDVKVRGSASQVLEKYLALARDATAAGDRIAAENYFQHAEHYYRILSANQAAQAAQRQQNGQPAAQNGQPNGQQGGGGYSRATPADPNLFDGDGDSDGDDDAGDQPQIITSETPQPI